MVLRVRVERSFSRSGLHARYSTYLAIAGDCSRVVPRVVGRVPTRPTYAKGEAFEVVLEVPSGTYVVWVDLRRNPRKYVKGDLLVLGADGARLVRAVYRKLKVRVVECQVSRRLAELILTCTTSLLRIPVKRFGGSGCKEGAG